MLSLYFARTRALSLSALSFVQCHNRLSQKLSKYQDTDSENARTSILKKKARKDSRFANSDISKIFLKSSQREPKVTLRHTLKSLQRTS